MKTPVSSLQEAPSGKLAQSPNLEKQDSAFIDRGDLASLIKKTDYGQKISTAYAITDSAEGNAAALLTYGPPKPICNESRLANIEELGCMQKASGDPQIRELHTTLFHKLPMWKIEVILASHCIQIHDCLGDLFLRESWCIF